ncbi:MAG TPA: GAF domain-containing SpoIIE family protein phosphatase [Terriglobales bacterium]|nr:GAF domain-containing SpoIIE family protein phosphatase [Terriglobales bacterium]
MAAGEPNVDGIGAAAAEMKRDYISAFANALTLFGTPEASGNAFGHIPSILVSDFDAIRSELWLWDDSSGSAYLTNAAGEESSHARDYSTPDSVVGKAATSLKPIHNAQVDPDFGARSGITHVSAFPLMSKDKLVGVCANYSRRPVEKELLQWWELCSHIAGNTLQQLLSDRENRKTITQLSLLFEATRLLNSTLDLAELLELILKIAKTEVAADRGTVFLVDSKNKQVWSIVAQGLDHQEIRVPFGHGVAGRVAVTGEIINVADAYTLDYFERGFDQKTGYTTKSLLCVPIRHASGYIVGVIQLLNQTVTGRFSKEDEEFLLKLSGHMAMALENARLHRDALEKQRLERELEMARGIQRSLLPDSPPIIPGYELSVVSEPCYEVGGDYYDFLSLGPQTLLLVIADVEGKGVSSALVMSNLQATLRALVMHLHSLEVLALSLNEMMYNARKSRKYLSIFLGVVDTRRNGLHYINAGHVPPILVSGESGEYKLLQDGGTVVGLFPTAEYQRGSARLNAGDILVASTDGITEACNADGAEYGYERLAQCVAKHRNKPVDQIIESVLAEVKEWAKDGVHVDDKVLMLLKVTKNRQMETAKSGKKN